MSNPFTPSNGGKTILTPGSGGDSFSTASDQSRLLPRQVSTGNYRGTQTITGELIVADPGTNHPAITISGTNQYELWTNPASQVNYMIAGRFPGTKDYGVKVAFPGVDVLKATDEQLIFNSNQNIFKIIASGTVDAPPISIVWPGAGLYQGTQVTGFTADLGFSFGTDLPAILAFAKVGAVQSVAYPLTQTFVAPDGNGLATQTVNVFYSSETAGPLTGSQVVINVNAVATGSSSIPVGSQQYSAKWYLLQETAG